MFNISNWVKRHQNLIKIFCIYSFNFMHLYVLIAWLFLTGTILEETICVSPSTDHNFPRIIAQFHFKVLNSNPHLINLPIFIRCNPFFITQVNDTVHKQINFIQLNMMNVKASIYLLCFVLSFQIESIYQGFLFPSAHPCLLFIFF